MNAADRERRALELERKASHTLHRADLVRDCTEFSDDHLREEAAGHARMAQDVRRGKDVQVGDVVEVKLWDGTVRKGIVNWAPEHCLAISFDTVIIPRTYEMTVIGRYGQDDDG